MNTKSSAFVQQQQQQQQQQKKNKHEQHQIVMGNNNWGRSSPTANFEHWQYAVAAAAHFANYKHFRQQQLFCQPRNHFQFDWPILAHQKLAMTNFQQQQTKKPPMKRTTMDKTTLQPEMTNGSPVNEGDGKQLRNGSKSSTNWRKSYNNQQHKKSQQQQQSVVKPDSTDSGISTTSSQQMPKARRGGRNRNQRTGNTGYSYNKTVAPTAAKTASTATAAAAATEATASYSIKSWLGSEAVFCYKNRRESSMAEDNLLPRHNPAHRSSTSSDLTAGEELQSVGRTKKKTSCQKRYKRRQQSLSRNNIVAAVPMRIAGLDEKENVCPTKEYNKSKKNNKVCNTAALQKQHQVIASTSTVNLRKKCTTSAALKLLQPSGTLGVEGEHGLSTSASYSSVCSSYSSSSPSVPSSAESSPTHSATSSPTASPSISKRHFQNARKSKCYLTEHELVELLRPYIIQPEMLRVYGFPVESAVYKRCIEIYKCVPKTTINGELQYQKLSHQQDAYEYHQRLSANRIYEQLKLHASSDTSDSSEGGEDEPILATARYTSDGLHEILKQYDQSLEKNCMRCKRPFKVSTDGNYLTDEPCQYHSGKLVRVFTGKQYEEQFTCCQGGTESDGCEHHRLHVWSGTVVGINGPYTDFEHTEVRSDRECSVYALDCEMCITGRGLEVTKVTVISYDGEMVYDQFVLPEAPIVDYNTRFSGIRPEDLDPSVNTVKSLREVQQDLLQLFDAHTILIGHALENDLRALRLVHKTIVDTSIVFPAHHGFPYRRGLKTLARTYLYRDIQCSDKGHSSLEDSRACMDLMLYRVRHPV